MPPIDIENLGANGPEFADAIAAAVNAYLSTNFGFNGKDLVNVGLVDGRDVSADGLALDLEIARVDGYVIMLTGGVLAAPADSSIYYQAGGGSPPVTATPPRIYLPKVGTVTRVEVNVCVQGTLGSAENGSLELIISGASNIVISAAVPYNVANARYFVNASTVIPPASYMQLQIGTPAWVTNPTNVIWLATVFIQM